MNRKKSAAPIPLELTSSEMLDRISGKSSTTNNPLPASSPPLKTMRTDANGTIAGLAKQLEAQEDQLISIQDGIGALDEKLWELRELAAKFPTRSMLESLSEKLDEILEKINERGDNDAHVEWPNE
jgi:hypothetical protein